MSFRRQRGNGSRGVWGLTGLLVLVAVGWLAAGCAPYELRPISPAATRDDLAARRLDAVELGDFLRQRTGVARWPPASWDLHALTLAAVFYSPDLEVARARWGVARAGEVTAGARPEPSLNAAIGYNSTSAGIRPWIPEAAPGLPVEIAGKRGSRLAEAGPGRRRATASSPPPGRCAAGCAGTTSPSPLDPGSLTPHFRAANVEGRR